MEDVAGRKRHIQKKTEIAAEPNVLLQHGRDVVHNKVDAPHLVHELHPVRQQHTPARLHLVALEELRPAVFPVLALDLEGLENVRLFLSDLRVVRRQVVDLAEDFQGLGLFSVRVEVSWRFGEAEDENDDYLQSSALSAM